MGNPFNDLPAFLEEDNRSRQSKRPARAKPAYKGISRIDSDENHTHGWYVRVRQDGKVKSKFFSDRKYGGIAKALMKARRFYKNQMREVFSEALGETPQSIPDRVIVTKNRHNNTGVVGVQRIERRNPGGSVYLAYRVCWTDSGGNARTKFFSVKKHGEKAAFEKARDFRKARLLEE